MASSRDPSGPRPLGRPRAADSSATRKRIIDAARRLFATSGYERTTNKDIARQAGLTTGPLYHYFDSRVDLYSQVFRECIERIYDRFDKVAAEAGGLIPALCAVADDAVALQAEDPTLASFLSSANADVHRYHELAELMAYPKERAAALWGSVVDAGIAAGEVPDDVDRKGVAGMIGAIFSGFAQFADRTDRRTHAQSIEAFKLLVQGQLILAPSDSRRSRSRR